MVVLLNEYAFDLVDAVTHLPIFSKVDPITNEVWYCAQPNQEYFISFQPLVEYRKLKRVLVDGKKLGINHLFKNRKGSPSLFGAEKGGLRTALKFAAVEAKEGGEDDEEGEGGESSRFKGGDISFEVRGKEQQFNCVFLFVFFLSSSTLLPSFIHSFLHSFLPFFLPPL